MTCGECGEQRPDGCACDEAITLVMCARCGTVYRPGDLDSPGHHALCLPCVDAIHTANEAERAKVTP